MLIRVLIILGLGGAALYAGTIVVATAITGRPVGVLATPNPSSACSPLVTASFYAEIDPLIARWSDVDNVARVTPRISLPPLIRQLQVIRTEANAVAVTRECTQSVLIPLVAYMDAGIDYYLLFLGQASDAQVNAKAEVVDGLRAEYQKARLALDGRSR